jgi:hypothetical protein
MVTNYNYYQYGSNEMPTAHVTVNRNRVKNYNEKIYLKEQVNFEIELWNPRTEKVIAHISINGKEISSNGIIINPGQRVYLERWIDQPKKFFFSTYEAENSSAGKAATEDNGKVTVNFHYEKHSISFTTSPYYSTGTSIVSISNFTGNRSFTFGASSVVPTTNVAGSFETGRVESGESSSQDLVKAEGDFQAFPAHTVSWKILPESAKPVEISKIRTYCTDCGSRVRASSWKFCPSCGKKF